MVGIVNIILDQSIGNRSFSRFELSNDKIELLREKNKLLIISE